MDMTMESCRKFVEVLASDAPAPGGGGAAALVGAIGTALGNMVGSLTVGKKKYAAVEAEIIELKAKCDALQTELLNQVEADEVNFLPQRLPVRRCRVSTAVPTRSITFPTALWC